MKDFMIGFINTLKRELELVSKDVDIIIIILLSPLFYALFYGSTYIHKGETDVPIAVVDMDRSDISRQLIQNMDAHQLVKVNDLMDDFSSAKNKVYAMEDFGVVFIPENFSRDLKSGKQTNIKIYLNTSRFLISNDLNKAINDVVGTLNAGIRIKFFQRAGYSFKQSMEMYEPIQTEMRNLYNTTDSYGDFLLPGSLILILQQTLLMGLAESVAKEREEKTFSGLEKASNQHIWGAITGKGGFYFAVYLIYCLFFFTVNFSIFKLNFIGNGFIIALLSVLFLAAVIMFGIFFASFFKKKVLAFQFFSLTSFPIFFISGYSWPKEYMPAGVQFISNLLPITPYFNAFVRVSQTGAGLADVIPQIIHLLILLVLGVVLAGYRFGVLWKEEAANV